MFRKLDTKKFLLSMFFSLILITILSSLLSTYTSVPTIKTGPAFILLFIGVFITFIFIMGHDSKIDKQEIWTMILIAIMLVISGWSLKHFFPSIFSALPDSIKQTFSSWGVR